jgi:hypothetical protein
MGNKRGQLMGGRRGQLVGRQKRPASGQVEEASKWAGRTG